MLQRTQNGDIRLPYMGGVVTIRENDSSFVAPDGKTIPLSKGIVITNGSIKSFLPFEAVAALVVCSQNEPELHAILKKNGIDFKKGLLS